MATSSWLPRVEGPPPGDPLPGMALGDYQVERAVASGGMGIVYLARHRVLGRKLAIKVLRPEFARNEEQVARFLKEARAVSAIHHRGIIDVHHFGHLPDGRQYMVQEFLEGETLETLLEREAPLHPSRALPLMDEVLDALSAAHSVGVVHRDLKPSNVFIAVQSNGARYAKLVDFGLAATHAPNPEQTQLSGRASLFAGTPEYMSPEQAQGLACGPASDLYSAGVMLFEMLTGGLPFAAPSLAELLAMHVRAEPPRVSRFLPMPPGIDDLVAAMLRKSPDERPRSAAVRHVMGRVIKEMRSSQTREFARPAAAPPAEPPDEPFLDRTHISGPQLIDALAGADGPTLPPGTRSPEVGRRRSELRVPERTSGPRGATSARPALEDTERSRPAAGESRREGERQSGKARRTVGPATEPEVQRADTERNLQPAPARHAPPAAALGPTPSLKEEAPARDTTIAQPASLRAPGKGPRARWGWWLAAALLALAALGALVARPRAPDAPEPLRVEPEVQREPEKPPELEPQPDRPPAPKPEPRPKKGSPTPDLKPLPEELGGDPGRRKP